MKFSQKIDFSENINNLVIELEKFAVNAKKYLLFKNEELA